MSVESDIADYENREGDIQEREIKEEIAAVMLQKGLDVTRMLCQQLIVENMPDFPEYDKAIIQAMQGNNSLLLELRDRVMNYTSHEHGYRGMFEAWGYELDSLSINDLRRMNGEKVAA